MVEKNAKAIHEETWQKVVNEAKVDKYLKYGIYCSRSLAVKHPEIYLQADLRFFEHISTNPGCESKTGIGKRFTKPKFKLIKPSQ